LGGGEGPPVCGCPTSPHAYPPRTHHTPFPAPLVPLRVGVPVPSSHSGTAWDCSPTSGEGSRGSCAAPATSKPPPAACCAEGRRLCGAAILLRFFAAYARVSISSCYSSRAMLHGATTLHGRLRASGRARRMEQRVLACGVAFGDLLLWRSCLPGGLLRSRSSHVLHRYVPVSQLSQPYLRLPLNLPATTLRAVQRFGFLLRRWFGCVFACDACLFGMRGADAGTLYGLPCQRRGITLVPSLLRLPLYPLALRMPCLRGSICL